MVSPSLCDELGMHSVVGDNVLPEDDTGAALLMLACRRVELFQGILA